MPKFLITTTEHRIYKTTYSVTADSRDEAVGLLTGNCDDVDGDVEEVRDDHEDTTNVELSSVKEVGPDVCPKCHNDMDKGCHNGQPRCPDCDGPCPGMRRAGCSAPSTGGTGRTSSRTCSAG